MISVLSLWYLVGFLGVLAEVIYAPPNSVRELPRVTQGLIVLLVALVGPFQWAILLANRYPKRS